jgi:hypothetical protein
MHVNAQKCGGERPRNFLRMWGSQASDSMYGVMKESRVWTRGAQQDTKTYRIQDDLYRIQYSLTQTTVYAQKIQVHEKKYRILIINHRW